MINVDFGKIVSEIKPVHGVNNGPLSSGFMRDASELFKKAGIPYSRLHDTEGAYGAGQFVDIPCIFKNFDSDPEDEKSYDFLMTDKYIEAIRNVGTKVIYRLGVSIENGPIKKYIYPPKDYKKWAKICEGIIRHYTQGWANGYTDAVEYFELWNEPEFLNHMWIGEYKDFYELFKSSIIYLKEKFPNVKIGGPADGLTNGEFTKGFFEYLTEGERAPLDFYSWHTYFVNIDQLKSRTSAVRKMLDSYGYFNAESICTEWNFVDDWSNMEENYELIHDNRGASFTAAALCEFQKSPIKTATYYDAKYQSKFNGLFKLSRLNGHDDIHGLAPRCTYYSFEKYNELYKLGSECYTECDDRDVSVLAATNGEHAVAIIARFNKVCTNDKQIVVSIKNAPCDICKIYRLDGESERMKLLSICHNLDCIELKNYDMLYIEWDISHDGAWGAGIFI